MSESLRSGVASARKSSTPASAAMAEAVIGLSPVIITVRMPSRRISAKRSRMPPLTMSLRWTTPSTRAALGDEQRRRPLAGQLLDDVPRPPPGTAPPVLAHEASRWRRPRPCGSAGRRRRRRSSSCGPRTARTARPRLCRSRPRRPNRCLARTTMLRPSGVSSASDASCAASASVSLRHARRRHERHRLPVAQRDRAGLVEQQHVDVAGSLDRPARHRQHVRLDHPIHAGDADRRQQPADGRRDEADQERDQHRHRDRRPAARRRGPRRLE